MTDLAAPASTGERIARLEGRFDDFRTSVNDRLDSMGSEIGETKQMVGRVEGMVSKLVESGPHPAMSFPPPDTDAIEKRQSTGLARIFTGKHGHHVVYGIVIVVLGIAALAAWSGRRADSLVPGLGTHEAIK